jgi:Domain of unknown function (DUF4159)
MGVATWRSSRERPLMAGGCMKLLLQLLTIAFLLVMSGSLLVLQRSEFQIYDQDDSDFPAGEGEKTEWAFARVRYQGFGGGYYGRRGRRGSRWSTDYPKADRQFVSGVRRLTKLDARSVEQVVDPDSDEIFNWPWLYAVEVGGWSFTPSQAERMRAHLLKGGFLMVDDFHGTAEWQVFEAGIRLIFPDRPIEDLPDDDEIFHVLYDVGERLQVPNVGYIYSHITYEKGGVVPHWRAIRDDNGRVMVAICHNMDLGDAWEWADHPQYPERFTSLAYRVGINYIIYGMTH